LPRLSLTMSPSLGFFGDRLRVSSMFDHRGAFETHSFTELHRCSTYIGNGLCANDPHARLYEQMRAIGRDEGAPKLGGGVYYGALSPFFEWIQYTRWREASVSLTLPKAIVGRLHARNGTLMLGARNLHLWTNYLGVDPDTHWTPGAPMVEGYVNPPSLPPPRYVILRLTLGM